MRLNIHRSFTLSSVVFGLSSPVVAHEEPKLVFASKVDCCSYAGENLLKSPLYKNSSASVEDRIKDLLSRMNLEEKVGQLVPTHMYDWINDWEGKELNYTRMSEQISKCQGTIDAGRIPIKAVVGGINAAQRWALKNTRLGIPFLISSEGIHGLIQSNTTVFPSPIGLAASFDPHLLERVGAVIGRESEVVGISQILAPVLDLSRELRWGRVQENFGEDPYLTGTLGAAYVRGLQSGHRRGVTNSATHRVAATLKHFAAHGSPVNGLNAGHVAGGERDLRMLYLPPFKKAIEAGALSVMSAYNAYDNVPASVNYHLLTEILKKEWDWDGYIYSDWGAISQLFNQHNVAESCYDAAMMAFNAGVDLDAFSGCYVQLVQLINDGLVSQSRLDDAVIRTLRTKFKLGLFENPFAYPDWSLHLRTPFSLALAYETTVDSIVLLQNRRHLLPIDSRTIRTIAVIGPLANRTYWQYGDYTYCPECQLAVSPLVGIRKILGEEISVLYAQGAWVDSFDETLLVEARKMTMKSDIVVVVVGDYTDEVTNSTDGETFDTSDLGLMGGQLRLVQEIYATGIPTIVVFNHGKPVSEPWIKDHIDTVIHAFYAGEFFGTALADILFGQANPSGRMPISTPRTVGTAPAFYNYLKCDKGAGQAPGTYAKFGHAYVFDTPEPLWAFGHGISYTTFAYSNMRALRTNVTANDTVMVTVRVTNTGDRIGREVVQLYVTDRVSSIATPVMELKGFKKVTVRPGEAVDVEIALEIRELAIYDLRNRWTVEKGEFIIRIGRAANDWLFETSIWVI